MGFTLLRMLVYKKRLGGRFVSGGFFFSLALVESPPFARTSLAVSFPFSSFSFFSFLLSFFPFVVSFPWVQAIIYYHVSYLTSLVNNRKSSLLTIVGWSLVTITISSSPSTNLVIGLENRNKKKSSKNKTPIIYIPTYTMRPSTILVSSLAVFGARAAPAQPKIDLDNIRNPASAINSLTEYFNLVASKTEISKVQPTAQLCDISKAQMPGGTSPYSKSSRP